MAVARLKFPTKRLAKAVAAAFEYAEPDFPRGARELRRAVDRPGLAAELTAEEMRALAEAEGIPIAAVPLIRKGMLELQAAEEGERARPRPSDIMAARFGRKP